jgi:anti-sigma regulatory factor (Ser/Thr protein kinase)
MEDLSLHILDIAENAVEAGATAIHILVSEDPSKDLLLLEIRDNGRGMDPETAQRAIDPFYTTRTTRRVGLGLPFLNEAAEAAQGTLDIISSPGKGTTIRATFRLSHIDRKPLGDIVETMVALIAGQPEMNFTYRHECGLEAYTFSTADIRQRLGEEPLNSLRVLGFVRDYLHQHEQGLHV